MFKKQIYNIILYNSNVKEYVVNLLNSQLPKNAIYRHLYSYHVKRMIDKYKIAPHCVKVEVTNACNSRCIICTHDKMKRKAGIMEWNTFKKIVDESAKLGIEHLSMHNFGEPLLDKSFTEKVKYAKSKNIKRVSTNTNGSLLTEEVASNLVDAGLDEIYISLDGATKETFELVRRGLKYDEVEKNVLKLIEIKKQKKAKKPLVVVDFVEFEKNKSEKGLFIEKWKNVADRVCISSMHNWGGDISVSGGIHQKHVFNSGAPCRLLWTDIVVNWDGTIPLCCQDTENDVLLGNIKQNTIEEIRDGKLLNEIRNKHLAGRYSEISRCSNCKLNTYWWMF